MKLRFVLFVICVIATSCKKEQPKLDYKYSDMETVILCQTGDDALFNEAIHTFEANLTDYYAQDHQNLMIAYNRFIKESSNNTTNYGRLTNNHTQEVFNALKHMDNLWSINGKDTTLNYNHPIFKCIGEKIQDEDLKRTYNALISTNSMSKRMFTDPLLQKVRFLNTDKSLATFVALEWYYTNLFDVDFSNTLTNPKPNAADPEEKDPHAGHNH